MFDISVSVDTTPVAALNGIAAMETILIADVPEGRYRAIKALGEHYDLLFAETFGQAVSILTDANPDLVICGVLFDDSRMLELLQFVRNSARLCKIPFIVMAEVESSANLMSRQVAKHLGATEFGDTVHAAGEAQANEQLKLSVEAALRQLNATTDD